MNREILPMVLHTSNKLKSSKVKFYVIIIYEKKLKLLRIFT